jgi:hypothetical protein
MRPWYIGVLVLCCTFSGCRWCSWTGYEEGSAQVLAGGHGMNLLAEKGQGALPAELRP